MQKDTLQHIKGLRLAVAAIAVAALAIAACGTDTEPAAEKPTVVTTIYPITYFTQEIAGDQADVSTIFEGSINPHFFEPTASDLVALETADLFVYHSNQFDAWVPGIINSSDVTAVASGGDFAEDAKDDEHADEDGDGHDHEGEDFHTWLNPSDAIGIATRIRDALLEVAPADSASEINSNADDLIMRLRALNTELQTQLASCTHDTFVISHATFAHFAEQFNLTQLAIRSGDSTEQSISVITGIRDTVSGDGIMHILSESPEGMSDDLLNTIAQGANAEILSVSIMEGGENDGFTGDYFQRMRNNARAFQTALDCS